jgi:hypothetical protein
MDLRLFYQKMRKLESEIKDAHVVVVSLETPDGGKPGRLTEVNRENAARLVVEGRALLASDEEAAAFRESLRPVPGPAADIKALDDAMLKMLKETMRSLQE